MPGDVHGFDDSAHDECLAFGATWSEEDVEVTLAVLPPFVLVKHAIFERLLGGKMICFERKSSLPTVDGKKHRHSNRPG